jgi:hypothetical protein
MFGAEIDLLCNRIRAIKEPSALAVSLVEPNVLPSNRNKPISPAVDWL